MITLGELIRRVHASRNPQITRIYLPDDEYEAVWAEAHLGGWGTLRRTPWGDEVRVAPAMAECYRLSELAQHRADEAQMRAEAERCIVGPMMVM